MDLKLLLTILTPCISHVLVHTTHAQTTESFKLIASDAAEHEGFGIEVATNDDLIAVGTFGGEIFELTYGSIYLFDLATGKELIKLSRSDLLQGDNFGQSLSLTENRVIAGAPSLTQTRYVPGAAYIFDSHTGDELFKLQASDAHIADYFGSSVASNDSLTLIGAPRQNNSGIVGGAAYLFDHTKGTELLKITADIPRDYDSFGASVAIAGNLAVIGAPNTDSDIIDSGSAYVFDLATGTQLHELKALDSTPGDLFGSHIAMSDRYAVVGAPITGSIRDQPGSAYVFDLITGNQIYKFTASDVKTNDAFGSSVSISGDLVIVGAVLENSNVSGSGAAYVFDLTTGKKILKLTAYDSSQWQQFGSAVAIHNQSVVIGAYGDAGAGARSGAVYLFRDIPEPSSAISLLILIPSMARQRVA